MEKREVRDFYQRWTEVTYDDDSDWNRRGIRNDNIWPPGQQEFSPDMNKLRKIKVKQINMKALDKVFDTQVITGIIGDKFHFIEAKKISYMKKRKENRQKDGIQGLQSLQRKIQQNFIKSKWIGIDNIKLQIWFNWFWKI